MEEIEQIRKAIEALEAQRALLGDAVVDTALAPLREKLASLQPPPAAEQRRLITVLFADLVGFTALADKMDAEDVHEIVNAYYTRWTPSIEQYGGAVEKFIGDAVMAVFGLAAGREDDPENAIRAALQMRQGLAELNQELLASRGIQLAMRTGVHTGPAVISFLGDSHKEKEGRDFVAIGDTLNVASRLQSIAPPGGILISHDTYRHVRGIFDVTILDPVTVKGKESLIQVYLVLQAKKRTFRTPTRGVEGIETHMVGRQAELQQLKDALHTTIRDRKTQIITLVGEAGIGKSRLMAEFDNWLELLPQVVRYFKCRATPSMENIPYSLIRDLFSFRFEIQDSDPPDVVQKKLETGLGEFAPPELARRAAIIGLFLGFRLAGNPEALHSSNDPRSLRDLAVSFIIDYFKALASTRSIVLLLEDLHWADASSLEIFGRLLEDLPDQPLLAVCAARPALFERHPGWGENIPGEKINQKRIVLKPLSREESGGLVDEILHRVSEIPPALREMVIDSAEGNPFYVEELLKMLIEDGVIRKDAEPWRVDLTRLSALRPPATLVEVLQARLDSLSLEEKVLLQRAAVIGRIFWDDAVRYMETAPDDQVKFEDEINEILRRLDRREMVFPGENSAFENTSEFYFKHALLRDVTYESVLKRLRRVYHIYAAQWLEKITQPSGRTDEYAAIIAEHYHHAGEHALALEWFERAGISASDRYANGEAIRCLTHCLNLLAEDQQEKRYELLLRRVKMYDTIANREAQKQDLEALQAISQRLDGVETPGKTSRRSEVSLQWWHYYDALGDQEASLAAAQEAVALAQAAGDAKMEVVGYLYLGSTFWKRANYPTARQTLEKGLVLARRGQFVELEGDLLRNLGITHQFLGNYTEALAHYEAARRIYHETGNEKGESMVLNSQGSLYTEQGRYHEAQSLLERSLDLKRKIGNRRAEHITLHNLGTIANELAKYTRARKSLEQVVQFTAATGDRDGESEALIELAVAEIHLGQFQKAQAYLERALALQQEIQNPSSISNALATLAWVEQSQGNYRSAEDHSREALNLSSASFLNHERAYAAVMLGHALLGQERPAAALEAYQSGLDILGELNHASRMVEANAWCGQAALAAGDLAEARLRIGAVLSALESYSPDTAGGLRALPYASLEGMNEPFRALLVVIQGLRALGDGRRADLLEAAHRLLQAQAAELDVETRQSFLGNIPWHRDILTEWKEEHG